MAGLETHVLKTHVTKRALFFAPLPASGPPEPAWRKSPSTSCERGATQSALRADRICSQEAAMFAPLCDAPDVGSAVPRAPSSPGRTDTRVASSFAFGVAKSGSWTRTFLVTLPLAHLQTGGRTLHRKILPNEHSSRERCTTVAKRNG